MDLEKEELIKIRENLSTEDRKKLVDEFNIKPGSLRNILSGRSRNYTVLERAAQLAKAAKEAADSREAGIKTIIAAL